MRIFNETKTIELTKEQCDLTKGYFKEEQVAGTNEYILIYIPYNTKQLYLREKESIEYWFVTEYREMFEKCTRRINLGVTMRDGQDPHIVLNTMYSQAESNANRINELENLINNC